jgi:hypothetical protein
MGMGPEGRGHRVKAEAETETAASAETEHGVTYEDRNRAGLNAPEWWRSRIVGHGQVRVKDVVNNPANWKIHPKEQLQAIAGSVQELGYFRSGTQNVRTGNLVDGHARVLVLDYHGVEWMDVEFIDVDEQEERDILMLIDPLATLAVTDRSKLEALMQESQLQHEDLVKAMEKIAAQEGIIPADAGDNAREGRVEPDEGVPQTHTQGEGYFEAVLVLCEGRDHQMEAHSSLGAQGYNCRPVRLSEGMLRSISRDEVGGNGRKGKGKGRG